MMLLNSIKAQSWVRYLRIVRSFQQRINAPSLKSTEANNAPLSPSAAIGKEEPRPLHLPSAPQEKGTSLLKAMLPLMVINRGKNCPSLQYLAPEICSIKFRSEAAGPQQRSPKNSNRAKYVQLYMHDSI